MLGIREVFLSKVVDVAIGLSPGCDAEVQGNGARIKQEVDREEERRVAVLFSVALPAFMWCIGERYLLSKACAQHTERRDVFLDRTIAFLA